MTQAKVAIVMGSDSDLKIREKMKEYKVKMEKEVEAKAAKLAEIGVEGYLKN